MKTNEERTRDLLARIEAAKGTERARQAELAAKHEEVLGVVQNLEQLLTPLRNAPLKLTVDSDTCHGSLEVTSGTHCLGGWVKLAFSGSGDDFDKEETLILFTVKHYGAGVFIFASKPDGGFTSALDVASAVSLALDTIEKHLDA